MGSFIIVSATPLACACQGAERDTMAEPPAVQDGVFRHAGGERPMLLNAFDPVQRRTMLLRNR